MSMPNNTPSPARPDTKAAFEAWAQQRYRSHAYLHTNSCTGDYDAYLAGRAAALEEAAQIADAEASVEGIAQRIAGAIRERAKHADQA